MWPTNHLYQDLILINTWIRSTKHALLFVAFIFLHKTWRNESYQINLLFTSKIHKCEESATFYCSGNCNYSYQFTNTETCAHNQTTCCKLDTTFYSHLPYYVTHIQHTLPEIYISIHVACNVNQAWIIIAESLSFMSYHIDANIDHWD